MTTPAHALAEVCEPAPIENVTLAADTCGGDGGGGGGGTTPTYDLQGVIQTEYYQYDSNHIGRRVHIRGYSRLADASNNRVDADYINVRCYAYDALGHSSTDYDSENNGALVDVHFDSPWVSGIGGYRTITVNCVHHATKYGVVYDTTSTTQINIPE
jgi:hypothetical protein